MYRIVVRIISFIECKYDSIFDVQKNEGVRNCSANLVVPSEGRESRYLEDLVRHSPKLTKDNHTLGTRKLGYGRLSRLMTTRNKP